MPSENGWEPAHATADQCEWVTVPGTNPPVSLQLLKGWPLAILRAFAADFNAYIEPLRDADSAGYTPTNSVATSNHLNGTAMDLNWNSHPFQVLNAGFDAAKIATIRELLSYFEDTVWWGNDWDTPKDAMHWNLSYNTFNNPHTADFIARKIRADGFSTFRRGNAPVIPPAAQVLSDATGLDLGRATEILPTVISGLQASECANVNRIAMWLAQCGEESAGFSTTEEFASGAEYEGRADLGNTQPGDGVRFKGRTWIQITGRAHYQEFSQWAFGKGLISSATQFVDNPTSLGDLPWAGIGAAWYWTVSRPDINSLSDAGDVVTVTHRINGGEHGLADRQSRYDRAHALGDQLLALATGAPPVPPTQGDDMALVPQQEWAQLRMQMDRVFHEVSDLRESRSPVREPDEGPRDTWSGFGLNTDGSEHVNVCKILANYGHPPVIALLQRVARMPVDKPGREGDCLIAQAILAEAEQSRLAREAKAAPVAGMPNNVAPVAVTPMAAPVAPQVVYVDRPVAAAPVALPAPVESSNGAAPTTTGQAIGALFDALESMRLADALPIEARAPLAALISVLQTKNGAAL